MRLWTRIAVGACVAATGCADPPVPPPTTSEMNVLFICLEDCTAGVLGCYGNPVVQTPHIDRLAATGVRFDRAYCQYPACNPSRASFLSGLRPETTGVLSNQTRLAAVQPEGMVTLPELVAPTFQAVQVGKLFHYAHPALGAFDEIALHPVGLGKAVARAEGSDAPESAEASSAHVPRTKEKIQKVARYSDRFGISPQPEAKQRDHVIGSAAVKALMDAAGGGERFFMSVGTRLPHTPLLCPQRFFELHAASDIELPHGWDVPRQRKADLFIGRQPTEVQARAAIRAYYGSLAFVDAQVGRILDALEEAGRAHDTIVVLFADHGFHLGEHGHWGKYTLLEGSTRVPLIVRVPGSDANGTVCRELVELVDLVPTLADLAGVDPPATLEGTSFVPLLLDPTRPWKRAAFSRASRGNMNGVSMRTQRYRYTRWTHEDGRVDAELFDLESEEGERVNLAGRPEHAELEAEQAARLEAGWQAAVPE